MSQTGPAAQAIGGTVFGHIRANLRDDRNCKAAVNAVDGTQQGDLTCVIDEKSRDDNIDSSNTLIYTQV